MALIKWMLASPCDRQDSHRYELSITILIQFPFLNVIRFFGALCILRYTVLWMSNSFNSYNDRHVSTHCVLSSVAIPHNHNTRLQNTPYIYWFTITRQQSWFYSQRLQGTFRRVRQTAKKTTINFVSSVCPSVRPSACNSSAPNGRIFMKLGTWVLFQNLSRKCKFR